MNKIAILTDSSAYLPQKTIDHYGIHIIPLKVVWGEKTYLDGIDITPEEFYPRLESSQDLPTTSQLTAHEFLNAFDRLATQYDGIIVPLISSGISGTVASAKVAASEFTKIPVEVLDTRSTASGLALITLAIARAVEQGKSLAEVTMMARDVMDKLQIFFAVDTLKYLHKGGRIGGASRYLGTMLGIKPILFMNEEGKIDALEKVRTQQKARERLIELAEKKAGGKPVHVGLLHANAFEEAAELQQRIASRVNCREINSFELSPVIAAHVGPGTIGVAVYPE